MPHSVQASGFHQGSRSQSRTFAAWVPRLRKTICRPLHTSGTLGTLCNCFPDALSILSDGLSIGCSVLELRARGRLLLCHSVLVICNFPHWTLTSLGRGRRAHTCGRASAVTALHATMRPVRLWSACKK